MTRHPSTKELLSWSSAAPSFKDSVALYQAVSAIKCFKIGVALDYDEKMSNGGILDRFIIKIYF